jgi:outer membrane protein OmpA-like peptidoglycan-associated protein
MLTTIQSCRFNSVANYLQGTGVVANHLQTLRMAESRPVSSKDNTQGRQENRRKELPFFPLQG